MRRKLVTLAGLVTGAFAGSVAYRRSLGRRRDRLDVYFEDGSMVTLVEGADEAERLLPVARRMLDAVRGA